MLERTQREIEVLDEIYCFRTEEILSRFSKYWVS